jgi:hypothetical protein
MSNNRNISMGRPGRSSMNRFNKKAEKLKNPKETVKRLLMYMSTKKAILVLYFYFHL